MRLDILNRGYGHGTKLLFALIRLLSGRPVPDAARLVFYRPDFYGALAKEFTHEAVRGPSTWSVGDRELMVAYVSRVNESAFCVGAHTATARQAYQDGPPRRGGAGRP
jgi:alkylhydroperoxidase family enzyme